MMTALSEFRDEMFAFSRSLVHPEPTAESVNAARELADEQVSGHIEKLRLALGVDGQSAGFGPGPLPHPYSDDDLVIDTPEIYLEHLRFWVDQTVRDWMIKCKDYP